MIADSDAYFPLRDLRHRLRGDGQIPASDDLCLLQLFYRIVTDIVGSEVQMDRSASTMVQSQNCTIQSDRRFPLVVAILYERDMLTLDIGVVWLYTAVKYLRDEMSDSIFLLGRGNSQYGQFAVVSLGYRGKIVSGSGSAGACQHYGFACFLCHTYGHICCRAFVDT